MHTAYLVWKSRPKSRSNSERATVVSRWCEGTCSCRPRNKARSKYEEVDGPRRTTSNTYTRTPIPRHPVGTKTFAQLRAFRHQEMNSTATSSTYSFEAVVPEATSHASLPETKRIPECYIPKPTFLLGSPNIMLSMQHHLCASTTTNQDLYEILQNIEKELATNRSIMLDIQSRLSLLEQKTSISPALVTSVPGAQHSQNQRNLRSPERKTWWDVYQSFLDSCDTPHSIHEPGKRPKNFSGFKFDFECSDYKRKTSSAPPDVGDIPGLTPTSERPSSTRPAPPNTSKVDQRHGHAGPYSMPRNTPGENDIVEHVVAVDRLMIPKPPLLQSPPRSRKSANSLVSLSNDITALPAMPSQPSSPRISQDRRSYLKQVKNRVERSSLKRLFRISRTTAHD